MHFQHHLQEDENWNGVHKTQHGEYHVEHTGDEYTGEAGGGKALGEVWFQPKGSDPNKHGHHIGPRGLTYTMPFSEAKKHIAEHKKSLSEALGKGKKTPKQILAASNNLKKARQAKGRFGNRKKKSGGFLGFFSRKTGSY